MKIRCTPVIKKVTKKVPAPKFRDSVQFAVPDVLSGFKATLEEKTAVVKHHEEAPHVEAAVSSRVKKMSMKFDEFVFSS